MRFIYQVEIDFGRKFDNLSTTDLRTMVNAVQDHLAKAAEYVPTASVEVKDALIELSSIARVNNPERS